MKIKVERRHLKVISNYMSATISMDNLIQEFYRAGSYHLVDNVIRASQVDDDILKTIIHENKNPKLTLTARDEFIKEIYKENFLETFYDSDCFKYIMDDRMLYMERVTYDEDVTAPIPRYVRLTVEDYKKVYGVTEVDDELFSEEAIEYGSSEFDADNLALVALTVACSMMSLFTQYFDTYMNIDEFVSFSLEHTRGVMDIYCDLFTTRTAEFAYTNSLQSIAELCGIIYNNLEDEEYIQAIKEYFGKEVSDDVISSVDKAWVVVEKGV